MRRGPRGGVRHSLRICAVCSREYSPRYPTQKTCGKVCGAQLSRQKAFLRRIDPAKPKHRRPDHNTKYPRQRGRKLQETIRRICDRDGWVCHICSRPLEDSIAVSRHSKPTVDHVIPLSKGGSDDDSNLKAAHWLCNERKGAKLNWKAVA